MVGVNDVECADAVIKASGGEVYIGSIQTGRIIVEVSVCSSLSLVAQRRKQQQVLAELLCAEREDCLLKVSSHVLSSSSRRRCASKHKSCVAAGPSPDSSLCNDGIQRGEAGEGR